MAGRGLLLWSEWRMFSYASLFVTSDSSVTSFVCEKCKLVACVTEKIIQLEVHLEVRKEQG